MKPGQVRKAKTSSLDHLDETWRQACRQAREAREQKQRMVEAMLRAGQPQPKREERTS